MSLDNQIYAVLEERFKTEGSISFFKDFMRLCDHRFKRHMMGLIEDEAQSRKACLLASLLKNTQKRSCFIDCIETQLQNAKTIKEKKDLIEFAKAHVMRHTFNVQTKYLSQIDDISKTYLSIN